MKFENLTAEEINQLSVQIEERRGDYLLALDTLTDLALTTAKEI